MEFTINDDLTAYSADEIAALIEQGNTALDALFANEAPTPADVAEARRINDAIASLQGEFAGRQSAAADMAALRDARVTASTDDPEVDEEDEEETDEEEVAEEAVEPEVIEAAAATRAPARVTPRAALAGKRPKQKPAPINQPIQITAAADVSGFAAGQQIADMETLARAVVARMKGFPKPVGQSGGQMQNFGVASFFKQFPKELISDRGTDDMEVLARATDQSRLPGGSLVAAGGWCAPSETMYDFCFNATPEGLVSLPEIQANRGGVSFTEGPQFADIYADTGFTQTEAQAIAGTAKSCYEIECPAFTEVRLDAIGLCIKVPILTNAAYPELTQSVISQALLAHQHRVSAYAIGKMVTASGAAFVPAVVGGATTNTLDGLELVAVNIRQKYRLPFNATIEGTAPHWLRSVIRADLANRTGVDLLAISDATIDGYLALRGINLQYVYNWQDLDPTDVGYPATAQVMLYPAGTFVKATTDVINLSAVYDAASLNVNTYTGLFMEEGIAVFKRCWASTLVTLNVCASGSTGAADDTSCFVAA